MSVYPLPPSALGRPLFPEDRDQGDPYILALPPQAYARFSYYVYTTGENPRTGRAFPVYGSHDLLTWTPLGEALAMVREGAHWAPCIHYIPDLDMPYVMLYSRSIGLGDDAHKGHTIYRAHSVHPEGPFVDSGHVLTPELDFAIDPDVYRLPDGSLKLAFAMDFVADEPYGTGIVEADINDDLSSLQSAPRLLARASHPWQVFEPARVMPWKQISGVDWTRDTVRWHTLEAPVGGLVSPTGQTVYLYSGGCFYNFYAVGALIEDHHGTLHDVSHGDGAFVIGPDPARGFYAPGHCSRLHLAPNHDYLMLHARFGSPTAPRQMCLARLEWTDDGHPYAGGVRSSGD